MSLKPLTVMTAREQAAHAIRLALAAGDYTPGTRLLETELADQLNVSRIPVREALTSLVAENLLERRNRSIHVPELSAAELAQIYLAREALEGIVYRRAAPLLTDDDIARIEAIQAALEDAAFDEASVKLARQNRLFHFAIMNVADLPLIVDLVGSLWDRTSYYRAYFWLTQERRQTTINEHRQIMEACRSRDSDRLVRLHDGHRKEMATMVFPT